MKTAGYQLEFGSREEAERAAAICSRETAGTGWQDRTVRHENRVHVKRNTELPEGDFHEDGFEEGETLFQKICFARAEECGEKPYSGVCHFEDERDKLRLRITVSFEEALLRFHIRRLTPERIQFWLLDWNRQRDGSLRKSEYGSFREKNRR